MQDDPARTDNLGGLMVDFLISNSLYIIAAVAFTTLLVSEYLRYIKSKNMTSNEFLRMVRARFNYAMQPVILKIFTAVILNLIISMVSFRTIWMNDGFHIIFFTMVLMGPVYRTIRWMFDFRK